MPHSAFFQRFGKSTVRIDCCAAGVLLIFLCGWHWRVTGHLALSAGLSLLLFMALCTAYGVLFTRLIAPIFQGIAGFPFCFLSGYFVFNTLLSVFALCSSLGMVANVGILCAAAIAGLLALRRRAPAASDATPAAHLPGSVAVLIACVGATISCGDAQMPLAHQNGSTIFRLWEDVYIHWREISVFANAHGLADVQDIKLAGARAAIYHFAHYLSPAAMSLLSGASAMQTYTSFHLPLGIVLTGLAAYCLMGKLFGWGPGLAATVAIVLFPDAFQQGFQNRYLSYNFMAQVNVGMLYGIACVALAWMFMLDACRRGKFALVLLAYGFLALSLFYKAHLFVANSYVLMMFPFIFFKTVPRTWRIAGGVLATAVFCLAVSWSQSNPRVPVLRLDGSGIGSYILQLLHDYEAGWMKSLFTRVFVGEQHGKAIQALYAAALLSLSTFGIWLLAGGAVLAASWRTQPAAVRAFPVIVFVNYLIMSMGLALDSHGVAAPDELVNRPLVWAYFAVSAWTAAAGYRLLAGAQWPRGKAAGGAVAALVLCLLAAVHSAPDLQTFPEHPEHATFAVSGAVPDCLVVTAEYLRLRSPADAVVQDGANDPLFILAGLSERQLYVGKGLFGGNVVEQKARLADVSGIAQLSDAGAIRQYFAARHIDWFLQHPDSPLAWPQALQAQPAFSCGRYRLFHVAAR